MRGGLRWLYRPFQVLCVLVAVLLTAAFSLNATFAGHPGGDAPIPGKPNLGSLGERLNANTIALISGNPNATGTRQRVEQFVARRDGNDASGEDRDHLFQQSLNWQARERP